MENVTPDNLTANEIENGYLSDLINVDLYRGINALINYSKSADPGIKEIAYKDSGIEGICKIAKKHLLEKVKNISVEYSLLASTLDPDNPGKLKCCSFSKGSESFLKQVDEKYVECINRTTETEGISLYQHRHFLYDLQLDDTLHDSFADCAGWETTDDGIKTCTLKNGECLTITIKKGVPNDKYSINEVSPTDEHFRKYSDELSIKAFVLSRSYEEMVRGARSFDVKNGKTVIDIQNSLHSFCHKNITNGTDDSSDTSTPDKTSVYFSFPIFSSKGSNIPPKYKISDDAKQGVGACFVYLEPNDDIVLEDLKKSIACFVSETSAFLRFVAVNYVFNMGLMLQDQAQKETIKSAKAAIMSRNMSHNIGSHVMSYLKQKLGSITAIMDKDNNVLYNLTDDEYLKGLMDRDRRELDNLEMLQAAIQNVQNAKKDQTSSKENAQTSSKKDDQTSSKKDDQTSSEKDDQTSSEKDDQTSSEKDDQTSSEKDDQTSSEKDDQTSSKKIEFPFLVGTGRFIGYLQERQDYIATIATDYIPYGAPVNLKDAIYDELNPDLRHMRHSNDDGNRPMNVLLSFIAKSEQLSRENMKIEGQTFSTHNDILFGYPKYEEDGKKPILFGIEPGKGSSSENVALTEMRKVNFSLPGGLVGRQAIFSIVENLIRNAAKHGKPTNNLELTFDVLDLADLESNKCYKDRVCDPQWRELYKAASDRERLYLFTITDNLTYDKSLAEKLRPALIEDYLDDRGNMRPTNKGIKEIRISAAWMRGEVEEERYLRYEDYEKGNEFLHKKKAPLVGLEITNEGHLRYMICLPQDRLAAVITEGMSEDEVKLFKILNEYSSKDWKLYKTIEEAKAKDQSKVSYHYMLVAPDKYNQVRPNTSNRLFVWNNPSETKRLLGMAEELEKMNTAENVRVDEIEKRYTRIKDTIIRTIHHVNDQSEPIYIWDETAYKENRGKSVCAKVLCFNSDENAATAKYVYRTHHGTKKDFETYYSKRYHSKTGGAYSNRIAVDAITGDQSKKGGAYSNIIAVDAITGDNSSDRIVRREPLNEEWYCSHLRALKKRVAIFDERLFMIVHNVDENKFISGDYATEQALRDVVGRLENGDDFQMIKDELQKSNLLREDTNRTLKFSTDSKKLIERLNNRIGKCEKLFTAQESENYKSVFYREKGVDVFTIVREKEGSFAIIGCVDDHVVEKENQEIEVICKYDKVATITSSSDPFDVKIEFQHTEFAKQYDYISIHQGILDKIYEEFHIKEHGEENDPKKCHVTKRLHEEFIKTEYKPIQKDGNDKQDFLPCFIIHSGRAKPTKNDMPQELPFVQYAAIEHGVLDCKYSLVELLDYARYES